MKNKKISVSLLCMSLLIGISSCGSAGSRQPTGEVTTTAARAEDTVSSTNSTLDDDINNPVDISGVVEEPKETLENPDLIYFGFYDMRVAGDIKPGVKLFEETYGGHIDYLQCAWDERIDKLQVLIASDQSPDLVDKESLSYPHLMAKNVYTDLTGLIDLTQPQWAYYDKLVEQYAYKGAHYYYPFTANALPDCLIYCKNYFEEYAMDDPKELYLNGEWTWNEFRRLMIEFMDNMGENAIGGIYGLVSNQIIQTTGTPLISMGSDSKISLNLADANVARAAEFLEDLRKQGLCVRGDGMWSNETKPLVDGKTAFLGVGQWKITDYCKDNIRGKGYEFGFVPYPRDPGADDYYYGTTTFGYMVPSGSKNPKGAATFIDIMRRCGTDPELKAIVKESIMNDKKYTEEQYEFLTSFEEIENYNMVIDISDGFSQELSDLIGDMLINVAFAENAGDPQSWAVLRQENEGIIKGALAEYDVI